MGMHRQPPYPPSFLLVFVVFVLVAGIIWDVIPLPRTRLGSLVIE